MIISFSFGKVDRDRIACLAALAVLPTVAGRGCRTESQPSLLRERCVQIAVVATYFLSAFGKLRFDGVEWVNSAARFAP